MEGWQVGSSIVEFAGQFRSNQILPHARSELYGRLKFFFLWLFISF